MFLGIQDYFSTTRPSHTEKSNIYYSKVIDAIANNKDTIMALLHELHEEHIIKQHREWLLVEGDAKIFDVLQNLKHEYGDELKWLIAYPGDWHMLKNYQCALMKPYFDAGSKTLAHTAGYPPAAIQTCSQFKRTHHFLLESWESLYRTLLQTFMTEASETSVQVQHDVLQILNSISQISDSFSEAFSKGIGDIHAVTSTFISKFNLFLKRKSASDDTCRFWIQFVLKML